MPLCLGSGILDDEQTVVMDMIQRNVRIFLSAPILFTVMSRGCSMYLQC